MVGDTSFICRMVEFPFKYNYFLIESILRDMFINNSIKTSNIFQRPVSWRLDPKVMVLVGSGGSCKRWKGLGGRKRDNLKEHWGRESLVSSLIPPPPHLPPFLSSPFHLSLSFPAARRRSGFLFTCSQHDPLLCHSAESN